MPYSLHNSEVFRVLHTQIYPRYGGTRERRLRTRLGDIPRASAGDAVEGIVSGRKIGYGNQTEPLNAAGALVIVLDLICQLSAPFQG